MKTRLNMLELKANFRGKYKNELCDLCEKEEDNTEHLFECENQSNYWDIRDSRVIKKSKQRPS